MNCKITDALVNATTSVFQMMLGCDVTVGSAVQKNGNKSEYEITGMVGITGTAAGIIALSMNRETANKAVEAMTGEQPSSDGEVTDVVAELINMIAENAKAKVDDEEMRMSIPMVVTGSVSYSSTVNPTLIPMQTPWGPLAIEVALVATLDMVYAR
jgi:chemotaxis protein CheX